MSNSQPTNQEILALLFCLAPEFKTEDQDTLDCYNRIIDAMRCQINAGVVVCCELLAYVYLLAHLLTLRKEQTAGLATSMSEGDLSISFARTADSRFITTTPWGRAYDDLIKRQVFAPTVSNVPKNFNTRALNGGCC